MHPVSVTTELRSIIELEEDNIGTNTSDIY